MFCLLLAACAALLAPAHSQSCVSGQAGSLSGSKVPLSPVTISAVSSAVVMPQVCPPGQHLGTYVTICDSVAVDLYVASVETAYVTRQGPLYPPATLTADLYCGLPSQNMVSRDSWMVVNPLVNQRYPFLG